MNSVYSRPGGEASRFVGSRVRRSRLRSFRRALNPTIPLHVLAMRVMQHLATLTACNICDEEDEDDVKRTEHGNG